MHVCWQSWPNPWAVVSAKACTRPVAVVQLRTYLLVGCTRAFFWRKVLGGVLARCCAIKLLCAQAGGDNT
jgi:hypothetical protein